MYKEEQYEKVVQKIEEIVPTIQNSILIPKFELLKAFAIGRYQERDAYLKALEFVLVQYGNTEEGVKAKQIVKQLRK